jgi:hypothetical protein
VLWDCALSGASSAATEGRDLVRWCRRDACTYTQQIITEWRCVPHILLCLKIDTYLRLCEPCTKVAAWAFIASTGI